MNKIYTLIFGAVFFCINAIFTSSGATLETWPCTYLEGQFTEKIKKDEVQTIIELGAYNGLDSILLHKYYNCPVYAFECDPVRLPEIRERFLPYPNITLVPLGAWHETKELTFYHCSFPGASSFYEFDLENLAKINKLSVEELLEQQGLRMTPVTINASRLDEWMEKSNLKQIDLICMDVQGACLDVLKGMGKYLDTVKYIITEVEYTTYYKKEALFTEINAFMEQHGFKCFFAGGSGFDNVMFINSKYIEPEKNIIVC